MKLYLKTLGHSSPISSVVFSSKLTFIASGSYDKTIKIWNFTTYELITTLLGHTSIISSLDIRYDDQVIVSGS